MPPEVDRIREEARRIADASLAAAERHSAAETPWHYSNYLLGGPATNPLGGGGGCGIVQAKARRHRRLRIFDRSSNPFSTDYLS